MIYTDKKGYFYKLVKVSNENYYISGAKLTKEQAEKTDTIYQMVSKLIFNYNFKEVKGNGESLTHDFVKRSTGFLKKIINK